MSFLIMDLISAFLKVKHLLFAYSNNLNDSYVGKTDTGHIKKGAFLS